MPSKCKTPAKWSKTKDESKKNRKIQTLELEKQKSETYAKNANTIPKKSVEEEVQKNETKGTKEQQSKYKTIKEGHSLSKEKKKDLHTYAGAKNTKTWNLRRRSKIKKALLGINIKYSYYV